MLDAVTPITLFQRQTERLRSQMPGVLESHPDSIHDARIATRRIREVLPLTYEWQRRHLADDLYTRFKRLGRALGRVRDADVRIHLIHHLESRHPDATAALVQLRRRQEQKRLRLMRKLVKRSERLDVQNELRRLTDGALWWRPARFWLARRGAWRNQLRHLIGERAHAAAATIAHATGVYFPNRSHYARVAIKKFRYAAEIAAQTGIMVDEPMVHELKKAQDVLGDLHDRQTLTDEVADMPRDDSGMTDAHVRLITEAAGAEITELHREFLARRAQVLSACDRAQQHVKRSAIPKAALAVAGLVAVTGLEARRRQRRSVACAPEEEETHDFFVKIPVPLGRAQGR
jgi:CHAD domain-containing protein